MKGFEGYVLLYCALCLLYILFFINRRSSKYKALFKVLPILVLVVCCVKMASHVIAPFHIKGPSYVSNLKRLGWGLIFSAIGDVYLVFDKLFIYGLLAFSISQGLYFVSFSSEHFYMKLTSLEMTLAPAILLLSMTIYFYLLPKVKWSLAIPAFFYFILISGMFWSALVQAHKFYEYSNYFVVGAIGAGLFYVSDMYLAVNIGRGPLRYAQYIVMVTYYAAQLLVTLGIMFSEA